MTDENVIVEFKRKEKLEVQYGIEEIEEQESIRTLVALDLEGLIHKLRLQGYEVDTETNQYAFDYALEILSSIAFRSAGYEHPFEKTMKTHIDTTFKS